MERIHGIVGYLTKRVEQSKTLFKKLRVSKQTWDEYNSIFSRINRYVHSDNQIQVNQKLNFQKNLNHFTKNQTRLSTNTLLTIC